MSGLIQVDIARLLLALTLIVAAAGGLFFLNSKLSRSVLIAGARMAVQLFAIGFFLDKVFAWQSPSVILLVGGVMFLVAIHANSQRITHRPFAFWSSSILAIGISLLCTLSLALFFILRPEPWYEARYFIPLLGLIMGNSLTGISLGMESITKNLRQNKKEIEGFLALGATPVEAGKRFLQEAMWTAMTPILNSMTIAGIVSLPGVMTGQVLSGASPSMAAKYQIVILCLLSFSTSLGAFTSVFLIYRRQFNDFSQLRVRS